MNPIDLNAAFGDWPIQYVGATSLESLDREYEALGIGEVWLSAVGSILAPEPDRPDNALFARLPEYPRFRPVKTVNPLLANWRSSLENACRSFPVTAVKLFPNYHDYPLHAPEVHELCAMLEAMGLPLLIQVRVNDERNQPTCLEVAGVAPAGIAALSREHPRLTIVALSAYLQEAAHLGKGSDNLLVDIAFFDSIRMLEKAKELMGLSRIVFGTAAAWMVAQPALLKLEYASLPQSEIERIASENLRSRIPELSHQPDSARHV